MPKSQGGPVGTCPSCGKLRFITRKNCRAWSRKAHPGEAMQVYECEGYYHYGHSPYIVMRGVIARSELMKP